MKLWSNDFVMGSSEFRTVFFGPFQDDSLWESLYLISHNSAFGVILRVGMFDSMLSPGAAASAFNSGGVMLDGGTGEVLDAGVPQVGNGIVASPGVNEIGFWHRLPLFGKRIIGVSLTTLSAGSFQGSVKVVVRPPRTKPPWVA